MIRKFRSKNKIREANQFVEADEVFLDSENIGNFDSQQFEGRIEKPINKNTIYFLSFAFFLCAILFLSRLGYLQINKGEAYYERSQNNTLNKNILFADRGIIYDRNKVELASNKKVEGKDFSVRIYKKDGFSHILGYLSYPAKDKSGNYWRPTYTGKDGLEKQYDTQLQGINGVKIVETDVKGKVTSENTVNAPVRGTDLNLTIDSRIQTQLFKYIKDLATTGNFNGGAGVIMNANTGEIISSVSYPEYDSNILSDGKDATTIGGYFTDKRKVFMDRTLSGLYTPGSIVKPFMAIAALAEKVIDPYTKILSTGSISIQNPYDKTKQTVFKDWRAQGWVAMRDALAVSSDVYFYEVGGGYENQKGLGIVNIEKYAHMFGIGDKTNVDMPDEAIGTIPSPEWKAKNFPSDPTWRLGDTYHTAIGQYGYQVTPMQMIRADGALANGGTLLTPHFILGDKNMEAKVVKIDLPADYFNTVHEGMRQSVTGGTSILLNVNYEKFASKTGTAQLGALKNKINSWIMGFFPYDHPKYVFIMMMESGPKTSAVGAPFIAHEIFDWMSTNTPEYFSLGHSPTGEPNAKKVDKTKATDSTVAPVSNSSSTTTIDQAISAQPAIN